MRKFLATAVIAASFAIAPMANALLIDDFNGGDQGVDDGAPGPDTAMYGNAVGGDRTLLIDNIVGANAFNGASANVTGGTFNHNNDGGVSSDSHIDWDAGGAGLGGIDITEAGTNDALGLAITTIDQGNVTLTFTVTDTSSAVSSLALSGLGAGTFSFLFSSFTGSANFALVDSIQLDVVAGSASDLTLDLVQTQLGTTPSVPLPGTIALMGLALGGLGAMRRRKAA